MNQKKMLVGLFVREISEHNMDCCKCNVAAHHTAKAVVTVCVKERENQSERTCEATSSASNMEIFCGRLLENILSVRHNYDPSDQSKSHQIISSKTSQ